MYDVTIEEIRRDLRAARPIAPDELRAHVLEIARQQPDDHRRLRLAMPSRRLALVVVPVCVAAALSTAGIYGLATSGDEPRAQFGSEPSHRAEAGRSAEAPTAGQRSPATEPSRRREVASDAASGAALSGRGGLPSPSPTRLQNYDVGLRLRVSGEEGLSRATQRALRITRGLGGYLVHVEYNTATRARGDAYLEVRVPVGRV
ncbi:MAG: hypothetical protein M3M94_03065, partial [Actinomycetota bacterium]|nr:hypothetical protein [Actinomycetota bacterium]